MSDDNVKMPQHTGTMSLAEAEALLDELRNIMTETKLPFGPTIDVYIERHYHAEAAISA